MLLEFAFGGRLLKQPLGRTGGRGKEVTLRDTPDEVRDYFKGMPARPHARTVIGEHRVRIFGDVAVNTGFYTFSDVRDGEATTFPARFSFVYRKQEDGRWLIMDHHSSAVPPPRK